MQQNSAQVTLSSVEIHDACARPESLNLFAAILLGDLFKHEFPPTHQAYWALLIKAAQSGDKELRYALGLPRGFAKTTLMKLFAVWLLIYTPHRFVLIVSAAGSLAEDVIKDILGFLSTQNCRAIWGSWDTNTRKDTQDDVRFFFRNKLCILKALGAEASVRGVNIDNERPSVIICEDAQNKESAESDVQNQKFIRWFVGTLVKARSYEKSIIVYIGNMYNERCLLNQLHLSPEWVSLITSAILASGESIWPAFRTKESILAEFRADTNLGQAATFLAEVMNDPHAEASLHFDPSKIPPYPYSPDELPTGAYLTIDPALGIVGGNLTVIALHHVLDGKDVVRKIFSGWWNDEQTVQKGLEICLDNKASLIAVEKVAYQATLLNYFSREIKRLQITGIELVPFSPGGRQKNARIGNFLRKTLSGEVLIHPEAFPQLSYQASRFSPMRKDNEDDILDAASMGEEILQLHWDLIQTSGWAFDVEFSKAKVLTESENCVF